MKRANTTRPVRDVEHGAIPDSNVSVAFVVLGQPVSMKNRRQMFKNRRTGKLYPGKSDEAMSYSASFLAQVPLWARLGIGSMNRLIRSEIVAYYASWRSDLDLEFVYDLLQKAGVVSNDRWIRQKWADGTRIDPDNPRIEIRLTEI